MLYFIVTVQPTADRPSEGLELSTGNKYKGLQLCLEHGMGYTYPFQCFLCRLGDNEQGG